MGLCGVFRPTVHSTSRLSFLLPYPSVKKSLFLFSSNKSCVCFLIHWTDALDSQQAVVYSVLSFFKINQEDNSRKWRIVLLSVRTSHDVKHPLVVYYQVVYCFIQLWAIFYPRQIGGTLSYSSSHYFECGGPYSKSRSMDNSFHRWHGFFNSIRC
jgi:hypothetical protein